MTVAVDLSASPTRFARGAAEKTVSTTSTTPSRPSRPESTAIIRGPACGGTAGTASSASSARREAIGQSLRRLRRTYCMIPPLR